VSSTIHLNQRRFTFFFGGFQFFFRHRKKRLASYSNVDLVRDSIRETLARIVFYGRLRTSHRCGLTAVL
jgi:hypothetical protein